MAACVQNSEERANTHADTAHTVEYNVLLNEAAARQKKDKSHSFTSLLLPPDSQVASMERLS